MKPLVVCIVVWHVQLLIKTLGGGYWSWPISVIVLYNHHPTTMGVRVVQATLYTVYHPITP